MSNREMAIGVARDSKSGGGVRMVILPANIPIDADVGPSPRRERRSIGSCSAAERDSTLHSGRTHELE